jgi:hypothetical protein
MCANILSSFKKSSGRSFITKKKGYPLLLKITKFQNMVNKKNIGDLLNYFRVKSISFQSHMNKT